MSAWVLVGMLVGTAGTALSAYRNIDPDVYWHRVLGATWLDRRSLTVDPDPVSFVQGLDWHPTAWLVEVLYATIVDAVGYGGLLALRLLLAAAFFVALGRYLYARFSPAVAALVLGAVGIPVVWVLQDRPQTISLVLVALMLPKVSAALTQDRLPAWWAIALFTWLWANMHGLWVIVPGLLALLAVIRVVERQRTWSKAAGLAVVSAAAAGLTPVGPQLLVSGLAVSQATGRVVEWGATSVRDPHALGLFITIAVLLVLGLRGNRPTARESLYVVAVSVYGLWASRNAPIAGVLLAPVLGSALDAGPARHLSSLTVPRWLLAAAVPALTAVAVSSYVLHAGQPEQLPRAIASRLAAESGTLRVVAEYNITGYLREFGGSGIRVSIDGRSDRYGADAIRQHLDMLDGKRGWRARLERLAPDAVVVDKRSPVRELLASDGWSVVELDGLYALMRPRS